MHITLSVLSLAVLLLIVEAAPKSPPVKKSPPIKKSPPPKRRPPPRRSPPPPPEDPCSRNGTGFFLNNTYGNGTLECTECPLECSFGGFCNVNSGVCVCPLDPVLGVPTTSGPSDGCGTCQINRDRRTGCRTYLDLCNFYNVSSYSTTPRNSIYTLEVNQTSKSYCDAEAILKGLNAGDLQCVTDFSKAPTTFSCECPDGAVLRKVGTKYACVDNNECYDRSYAGFGYRAVDPCYNVGTSKTFTVLEPILNVTTGVQLVNTTTGAPLFDSVDYILPTAYGAACVNLVWQKGISENVRYNCTCPPCYYASSVDDAGIVTGCDPMPYCQMAYRVQYLNLFSIDGAGFPSLNGVNISVALNATPAFV